MPSDYKTQSEVGYRFVRDADYDKAIPILEQALQECPETDRAYLSVFYEELARCYCATKQDDKAIARASAGIKVSKSNWGWINAHCHKWIAHAYLNKFATIAEDQGVAMAEESKQLLYLALDSVHQAIRELPPPMRDIDAEETISLLELNAYICQGLCIVEEDKSDIRARLEEELDETLKTGMEIAQGFDLFERWTKLISFQAAMLSLRCDDNGEDIDA